MAAKTSNALSAGLRWSHHDNHFIGYTVAGVTTSLVYENASMVFDLGQGMPFNIPRRHYFLTHCHSDHAGGLPYILSQRSLWSLPAADVYVLPQYREPLMRIVDTWQTLEDFSYPYNIHAMPTGASVDIERHYTVTSFPTVHRVPSQGYLVSKKKKRLKDEFRGKPRQYILEAAAKNVEVNEFISDGLFAFTGDTQIEFLKTFTTPVEVLFMETTFMDSLRTIDDARKWGHIHFDEWKDIVMSIPAEKIVLIHLSSRYGYKRVEEVLNKTLKGEAREKVSIFPRPF